MYNNLPDIHKEIAEVMIYFRHLVEKSQPVGTFSSTKDKRVLELTDTWLELQKAEAMGIYMPQSDSSLVDVPV